jgi:hypothetical protein
LRIRQPARLADRHDARSLSSLHIAAAHDCVGERLSRKLAAVWSTHNRPGALRELSLALRMRQAHAQRHRLMRAARTGEVVVIHSHTVSGASRLRDSNTR